MRTLPPLLALLLLAAPASAQEDACTQEAPCPWVLDVDEDGILGEADLNATVGDWYVLQVLNFDAEAHTLTLEGHDVSLTVPAGEEASSGPIHLDTTGAFSLQDDPSGDVAWLEVRATDVVADEERDGDAAGQDGEGTPLPLAIGIAAVLGSLLLRRR